MPCARRPNIVLGQLLARALNPVCLCPCLCPVPRAHHTCAAHAQAKLGAKFNMPLLSSAAAFPTVLTVWMFAVAWSRVALGQSMNNTQAPFQPGARWPGRGCLLHHRLRPCGGADVW